MSKKTDRVDVIVLKDFWREASKDEIEAKKADSGGNVRVRRGQATDMTTDDALNAIESGAVCRDTPQNRKKIQEDIIEAEEAARLRSEQYDAEQGVASRSIAVA